MRRLLKMDETVLCEHAALGSLDECYYLLEYSPGKRFGYAWENDVLKNLKRRIDRSDAAALQRKRLAIRDAAEVLRPALGEVIDFSATTIVPVPPSRLRSDVFYDDRVVALLRQACPDSADIRESIVCRADGGAAHESEHRPSVDELIGNYELGEVGGVARETIVIFDDVITSGNHFLAARRFLLGHFPGRRVVGVFLARRKLGR